jgi:hypothetical protein
MAPTGRHGSITQAPLQGLLGTFQKKEARKEITRPGDHLQRNWLLGHAKVFAVLSAQPGLK